MAEMRVLVQQDSLNATGEGQYTAAKGSKLGYAITMDFYTQMAIEGRGYQVRAGTIVTGLAADEPLADTKANISIDAAAETTIIPVALRIAMKDVATATTLQVHMKGVGAVSTGGAAFVPLPLYEGGIASTATARVATAGGVTVAAELATTTVRLFEFEALQTQSATVLAVGALGTIAASNYKPILPYIGVGPACVYVQVGSTTAATLHYGTVDFISLPTANIS